MTKGRRLSPTETRKRLAALGIERAQSQVFAFQDDARRMTYGWHSHRRHQLLYSMRGTARLESEHAEFLLPPQRAAWIPAGVTHATHVGSADTVSLFFDRSFGSVELDRLQVFDVTPLLREMVLYSRRWPPSHTRRDSAAHHYFRALLVVIRDVTRRPRAYELPRGRTEHLRRAMRWVERHLESASLEGAARASGTTQRTLRRRFLDETGLIFRDYLAMARLHRAIDLLSSPSRSLLEVALEVGFQSQSAFTQAFRRGTGQTPRQFRVTNGYNPST
jgi:AraC-like DNA-binding protein